MAVGEDSRLTVRLPLLFCFAMFTAWQMGVIYFSTEAVSLAGPTPLPAQMPDLTGWIVAGYVASIAFMAAAPRLTVWAARIAAGVALAAVAVLFLPGPPSLLVAAYCLQCFCCLFLTGLESAVVVYLFNVRTALAYLLVGYGLAFCGVSLLQNDVVSVPFSVFRGFAAVALAAVLVFFGCLPADRSPRFAARGRGGAVPKALVGGSVLLWLAGCFVMLFGNSVAETAPHGTSVYYLSGAVAGLGVYLLWRRGRVAPVRSAAFLAGAAALGQVAAIVSLELPGFAPVACALLGVGHVFGSLLPFFGLLVFRTWPSRFLVPVAFLVALLTVAAHSAILDALRGQVALLYLLYLAVTVTLIVVWLILEPYLMASAAGGEAPDGQPGAPPAAAARQTLAADDEPGQPTPAATADALAVLSPREREVVDCVLRGLRRAEIAAQLFIQPGTVDDHRASAYRKLGIHSRSELFRYAHAHGYRLADRSDPRTSPSSS
ncbi:MAG: helix-turn-helix transcriptional regulator [Propionibacteriaceae bacterium]|nr:helix-turn-helix transcriptional regulator [Propionibacteriaceae bacterium]